MTATTKTQATDISAIVQDLKAAGNQFAVATVVRTVSVTAAKPGAKAIIDASGQVVDGWIGGGCARGAVIRAAKKSIEDGEPRLVSLRPEELLKEEGLNAGEELNGVLSANNMCPSRGSMDIFVEPVLSDPQLLIIGASPVARMLATLARSFTFDLLCASEDTTAWSASGIEPVAVDQVPVQHRHRYIVVATQGSGDTAALEKALALEARQVSFVGSPKKMAHLKNKLRENGLPDAPINAIKGPAGLDIGAVTPQEIALSILAEIVSQRRQLPPSSAVQAGSN